MKMKNLKIIKIQKRLKIKSQMITELKMKKKNNQA